MQREKLVSACARGRVPPLPGPPSPPSLPSHALRTPFFPSLDPPADPLFFKYACTCVLAGHYKATDRFHCLFSGGGVEEHCWCVFCFARQRARGESFPERVFFFFLTLSCFSLICLPV